MSYILVGSAWVYANGSLHIGHLAGLLPADVIARYHRAKGDRVFFVSGSDCHGTPVSIRAKQENKSPQEISDAYHEEFKECFEKLGFSYDLYTKTSSQHHKEFVKDFHRRLYNSPYIYEKEAPRAYCGHCGSFLADRYVTGLCPVCKEVARGDQCDCCGAVLEPESLIKPECAVCHQAISFQISKHLYISLSKLESQIKSFINAHSHWKKNAVAFSEKYIGEGLKDRALTRDLDWGIKVPKEGYENKTIYIWTENVLGYLSASKEAAGEEFSNLWGKEAKHYYVHGKDNIPFHTIILPALLIANGEGWHLPDEIVSSEHLTLEGRKISTSQNHAIWIKDIINEYQPDSLRYYLLANGPEKRDADFSIKEFKTSHNSELVGAYGNFVHRSLTFIKKYLEGTVPEGKTEREIEEKIDSLFKETGERIERGCFREAVNRIFEFVRFANKYFDSEQPWITRNTDRKKCENTLFQCVQISACLAVVLYPFLPFSSEKVCRWLGVSEKWKRQNVPAGYVLPEIEILFERLEK
ncbi:MAG: methionine--tRNA ligase [Lachnospiraceae bacterium]|nr:methionine--tRNA ligase [Lachnospiraceae bacterium]